MNSLSVLKRDTNADVLRATAVLLVIAYHLKFSGFSLGYLGVDVFFVLSGYLIIRGLIHAIERKEFSYFDFIRYRAIRIFPAFFSVLFVTAVVAYVSFPPVFLRDFSQALVSSSLFLSNVLYYIDSGYFDTSSSYKPLIHTWSISVEQQFYLIFPLCLLALSRLRVRFGTALLGITFLSLSVVLVFERIDSDAAFYFFVFRAWEFSLGGVVFCLSRSQRNISVYWAWVLLVALCAMVFGFIDVVSSDVVRQIWVGVCVGGILMAKPLISSGSFWYSPIYVTALLSYSLYLVHQPIISFFYYFFLRFPSGSEIVFVLASILLFALALWFFVERQFLRGSKSYGVVFGWVVVGSTLVVMGFYGHLSNGMPQRFNVNDRVVAIERGATDINPLREFCHYGQGASNLLHPIEECLVLGSERSPLVDVVFIGDSHLDSLSASIRDDLKNSGLSGYLVSYAGCIPVAGLFAPGKAGLYCDQYNKSMVEFARRSGAKAVVLVGRFPLYIDGTFFDNTFGGVESYINDAFYEVIGREERTFSYDQEARVGRVTAVMAEYIEQLKDDFEVIVVDPVPEAGWDVPLLLSKQALFPNLPSYDGLPYELYEDRLKTYEVAISNVHAGVKRVKTGDLFCDQDRELCRFASSGLSLYTDDDHPSRIASDNISAQVVSLLEEIINRTEISVQK